MTNQVHSTVSGSPAATTAISCVNSRPVGEISDVATASIAENIRQNDHAKSSGDRRYWPMNVTIRNETVLCKMLTNSADFDQDFPPQKSIPLLEQTYADVTSKHALCFGWYGKLAARSTTGRDRLLRADYCTISCLAQYNALLCICSTLPRPTDHRAR
jgi:hypothetical protein